MAIAPPIPTNQGGVQTGLPKLPGPSAQAVRRHAETAAGRLTPASKLRHWMRAPDSPDIVQVSDEDLERALALGWQIYNPSTPEVRRLTEPGYSFAPGASPTGEKLFPPSAPGLPSPRPTGQATTTTPTGNRLPGPSGPTTTQTRPTSATTTVAPPPGQPGGTPSGPPAPVGFTPGQGITQVRATGTETYPGPAPISPPPPPLPPRRGYQPQRVTDEASAYALLGNPPPGGPQGFLVEIDPAMNEDTGEWDRGGYYNLSTGQWETDASAIASHQQMVNDWEAYEIDRTRAVDFLGGQDITAQEEIENNYRNAQLELDKWKADMTQQNNQITQELQRRTLELDTFIRNGQLEEAIASRQQSRELEQNQMRMQFILAIASNPAALFMLNQMGQLGQMTQGLGIDLTGLMANFQAAVPQEFLARMPNTQQWARLSPQIQQMILAYHMSRTGKTADQLLTEQRQQAPGSVGGTPQMIVR